MTVVVLWAGLAGCAGLLRQSSPTEIGPASDAAGQSPGGVAPDGAQRIAELEQRLREREAELLAARAELAELQRGLGRDAGRGSSADAPAVAPTGGGSQGGRDLAENALAKELERERAERQALMEELERLRQEVSSPFGESYVTEQDYLALKQELMELRRALQQQERALREQIAGVRRDDVANSVDSLPPSVEEEHVRLAVETQGELAQSRKRITELEAALEAAKKQGEEAAALAAENEALRSQLTEERRRAQALEAKLKVAARVTDLIFRMRTQKRGVTGEAPAR